MSKLGILVSAGSALVLLSACADTLSDSLSFVENLDLPKSDNYEAAKDAGPADSAFNQALQDGYLKLASAERDRYDWRDSARYADKALAAAEDQDVAPEPLYERRLPKSVAAEAAEARKKLMAALPAAKSGNPQQAARAQTSFDCWLEEQEENHQSDDISACRGEFYDALAALGKGGTKAAGLPARDGDNFLVYFGFNSSKLTDDGIRTVISAAEDLKSGKGLQLQITGHTDKAGPDVYNDDLSKRRVMAVKELLLSAGVKVDLIGADQYGENQPLVATPDNAANQANRRVEIKLIQ